MKKIFDIYGSQINDLQLCLKIIESAFDIQFEAHDSSYLGVYYRWGKKYGEEFILQNNYDESEREFREKRFFNYKTLLYVNLPSDPDGIRKKLSSFANQLIFLERKELP